jgi:hypothetical protein
VDDVAEGGPFETSDRAVAIDEFGFDCDELLLDAVAEATRVGAVDDEPVVVTRQPVRAQHAPRPVEGIELVPARVTSDPQADVRPVGGDQHRGWVIQRNAESVSATSVDRVRRKVPVQERERNIHRRVDPELKGSVGQVADKGYLTTLLESNAELGSVLHYDPENRVLGIEDPQFVFFIRNLLWNKFAERVGYLNITFSSRYDFALSFAGVDRALAEELFELLSEAEFEVFYDRNE